MRRPWAVTAALLLAVLAGGATFRAVDDKALFTATFGGPRSCATCHRFPSLGGVGRDGLATVRRVGRCGGRGSGVVRNAPPLYGAGLIDAIPAAAIRAGAVPRGDGVHGRVNAVGGRAGRFGWKGDVPTLAAFVALALRTELGASSPRAPGCQGETQVDADVVDALTAEVASFAPPPRAPASPLFTATGCGRCHVGSLAGVPLYSDLLLHDMGTMLDDGEVQATARGADWRTTPLWGLSRRTRYLHDGRATSLRAAIEAHGGEAGRARARFRRLTAAQQRELIAFLAGL